MDTIGPSTASGEMIALRRPPLGKRASTIGLESSGGARAGRDTPQDAQQVRIVGESLGGAELATLGNMHHRNR